MTDFEMEEATVRALNVRRSDRATSCKLGQGLYSHRSLSLCEFCTLPSSPSTFENEAPKVSSRLSALSAIPLKVGLAKCCSLWLPPSMLTVQFDRLWHYLCPSLRTRTSILPWIKTSVASSARFQTPSQRRCYSHCLQRAPFAPYQYATLNSTIGYRSFQSIQEIRSRKQYINPDLSTQDAYEELRAASRAAHYRKVQGLVELLVNEHHAKPSSQLYHALMLANANAQHGTPQAVDRLLREMIEQDIAPDSAMYHAALKVKCL